MIPAANRLFPRVKPETSGTGFRGTKFLKVVRGKPDMSKIPLKGTLASAQFFKKFCFSKLLDNLFFCFTLLLS